MEIELGNLLVVAAVAAGAPLVAALVPALRLPSVVLEIAAGIVLGPQVLDLVARDEAVEVLGLLGLAFLLFMAGLEVDFARLRGRVLRLAAAGFAVSFAIAVAAGTLLGAAGAVDDGLFVAIVLAATSLGVVIPVLKDAGEASTPFGQLVIAAASIADFATVVLLTLLFSREATATGTRLLLLGAFALAAVAAVAGLAGLGRSMRLSAVVGRLQDTTAQIRVRGAFLLLVAFAALAAGLGLEVILGAFVAGAVLSLVDRDTAHTHPHFRTKLEGAGFGFFIPVFFVGVGIAFDLDALVSDPATLAGVPVFLVALVAVRGLPAALYRDLVGTRRAVAAGLLQATSLPFIVASTMIGAELGVVSSGTAAALVGAGLVSVLVFPPVAAVMLQPARNVPAPRGTVPALSTPEEA